MKFAKGMYGVRLGSRNWYKIYIGDIYIFYYRRKRSEELGHSRLLLYAPRLKLPFWKGTGKVEGGV